MKRSFLILSSALLIFFSGGVFGEEPTFILCSKGELSKDFSFITIKINNDWKKVNKYDLEDGTACVGKYSISRDSIQTLDFCEQTDIEKWNETYRLSFSSFGEFQVLELDAESLVLQGIENLGMTCKKSSDKEVKEIFEKVNRKQEGINKAIFAQIEKNILEKEILILKEKKKKCMTYGFEDGTEGMGLCLVELDKLAEIEKQTLILKEQVTNSNNQSLARSKEQANLIAQQIANEKRQREAQALINLSNLLLGKGGSTCSFTCPEGLIVHGSCNLAFVNVGNNTCWKK